MNDFSFVGSMSASKSIYNRALIAQSYATDLEINAQSQCDDVNLMKKALFALMNILPVDCGAAGTVLRFVALRAARIPGIYELKGTERLLSRLPNNLMTLLRQLGCTVEMSNSALNITSRGWQLQGDGLYVDSHQSSQFASAVLLNCWDLDQPLHMNVGKNVASRGYLNMTLKFMESLGFVWEESHGDFYIPKHQQIKASEIKVEIDMSSAFTISALAALSGQARILNFPVNSWQPDSVFPEILKIMNVPIDFENSCLKVSKVKALRGVEWNLSNAPDLFPVLSVLCAFAEGESHLFGASQLQYKESNRIGKISELLNLLKVDHEKNNDGIKIKSQIDVRSLSSFDYDSDQDHRLAMAAGILKKVGVPINIINAESVTKSFPEYWEIIGE